MLRVQAFITSQTGCEYTVEARAEDVAEGELRARDE